MAQKIDKWEAETDPPTVHDTQAEAVAAELEAMLGHKGGSDSQVPALVREMTKKPQEFVACLRQLIAPERPTGPVKRL
jgi:hypothetical protein